MLLKTQLEAPRSPRGGSAAALCPAASPRQFVIRPNAAASRRILFVTSEISGFVKTGGLGDVSAARSRALANHRDVRALVPGYRAAAAVAPVNADRGTTTRPVPLLLASCRSHAHRAVRIDP